MPECVCVNTEGMTQGVQAVNKPESCSVSWYSHTGGGSYFLASIGLIYWCTIMSMKLINM